jgi:hypothetical protein
MEIFEETNLIKGHDDTLYVTGGNAKYNVQSNIVSLEAMKNSKVVKDFEQIDLQLSDEEFLKELEKSLNLDESIVIQLRRLFYALPNSKNQDKKFCHKNPKQCILNLLDLTDEDVFNKEKDKIKQIIKGIEYNIEKRDVVRSKFDKSQITGEASIYVFDIDVFINIYKKSLPILEEIEQININIAKKIEELITVLFVK